MSSGQVAVEVHKKKEAQSFCGCISRVFVWYSNIIFFIAGCGIIAVGAYIHEEDIADWAGKEAPNALMAFGVFMCFVALLALCGARTGGTQKCLMGLYVSFLCILLIGKLVVVIVLLTHEGDAKSFLQKQWNKLSKDQQQKIMETQKCGQNNPTTPIDCYNNNDQLMPMCFEDCYQEVKDDFTNYASTASIVAMIVVGYECLLLVFSCCLMCENRADVYFYDTKPLNPRAKDQAYNTNIIAV